MTVYRETYETDAWKFEIEWTEETDDSDIFIQASGALKYQDALELGVTLVEKLRGGDET